MVSGLEFVLSENWIQISDRILKQLNHLEDTTDKDRLELVKSLSFILNVLHRSLIGWMQWVNNPDIMSIFSQSDLIRMTKNLIEFSSSFVKFDMEITRLGVKKGLKTTKKIAIKKRNEKTEHFYV